MKLIYSLIISLFIISCNNKSDNPPNFILILADDQGWSGTSVKMSSNNDYSKRPKRCWATILRPYFRNTYFASWINQQNKIYNNTNIPFRYNDLQRIPTM